MARPSFVPLLIAAGLLAAALGPAHAQNMSPNDDRYFMLHDPFRPGPRARPSPFIDFPDRDRAPAPDAEPDQPGGTIYGSMEAADRHRTSQATEYVVVLGDSLADQLAQGLADAFVVERPEVAVVKKTRASSGLVRADFYDWPAQVPALLDAEKPSAVVILLGMNDRQVLRDAAGGHEVRSDRWRELYAARVEAMVAAVKTKTPAVFIVGLPAMRLPRLSADMQYINEILRERAQKLGVVFVDVWDGFVDEAGEFAAFGPALDGQRRRLRIGDGVHMTRVGARKLAHYVERDLVRLFDQKVVPGQPLPTEQPETTPSGRPIAGPVLPLTQPAGPVGALAGAQRMTPLRGDETATRVLVEGTPVAPVAGRADDYRWPRPAAAAGAAPPSQKVVLPVEPPAAAPPEGDAARSVPKAEPAPRAAAAPKAEATPKATPRAEPAAMAPKVHADPKAAAGPTAERAAPKEKAAVRETAARPTSAPGAPRAGDEEPRTSAPLPTVHTPATAGGVHIITVPEEAGGR